MPKPPKLENQEKYQDDEQDQLQQVNEQSQQSQDNQTRPKIDNQQLSILIKNEQDKLQSPRPASTRYPSTPQSPRVIRYIPRINRAQVGPPLFATKTLKFFKKEPQHADESSESNSQDISDFSNILSQRVRDVDGSSSVQQSDQQDQIDYQQSCTLDQIEGSECQSLSHEFQANTVSEEDSNANQSSSGQPQSQKNQCKDEKDKPSVIRRKRPPIKYRHQRIQGVQTGNIQTQEKSTKLQIKKPINGKLKFNLQMSENPLKMSISIKNESSNGISQPQNKITPHTFKPNPVKISNMRKIQQNTLLFQLDKQASPQTKLEYRWVQHQQKQGKIIKRQINQTRPIRKFKFSWQKGYRSLISGCNFGRGVYMLSIPYPKMITFNRCLNGMLAEFLFQTYKTKEGTKFKKRLPQIQEVLYYVLYLKVKWNRLKIKKEGHSFEELLKNEPEPNNIKRQPTYHHNSKSQQEQQYEPESQQQDEDCSDTDWFSLYSELMPSEYLHMPTEKSNETALQLISKCVALQVQQKRLKLQADYMSLNSLLALPALQSFFVQKVPKSKAKRILEQIKAKFTLQAFMHCNYIVTTRQFSLGNDYDYPVLVPLVDFFNHDDNYNCQWGYNAFKKEFFIKTLREIKAGQELTVTYGSLSNREMFFNYGIGRPWKLMSPFKQQTEFYTLTKLSPTYLMFHMDDLYNMPSSDLESVIEYIHSHWKLKNEEPSACFWQKKIIHVRFEPLSIYWILIDIVRKVVDRVEKKWCRAAGRYPRKRIQFDHVLQKRSLASAQFILFTHIFNNLTCKVQQAIVAAKQKLQHMLTIYLDKDYKVPSQMMIIAKTNMDKPSLVTIVMEEILVLTKVRSEIERLTKEDKIRETAQIIMKERK